MADDDLRNVASAAFKLAMDEAAKHGRGKFHEIMLHMWLELTHNTVTNGTSFAELSELHRLEMEAEAKRDARHRLTPITIPADIITDLKGS